MKKKFIYSISIFLISLLLLVSSCSSPSNWQTVAIDGYGTIKVPEDWKVSIIDDYMYFSIKKDGDEKYVLIQYDKSELETSNKYFAEIKEIISIEGEIFSNSAGINKDNIVYNNGDNSLKFLLYFTRPDPYNYGDTTFICLDDSISEETLRLISNSYKMYEY